MDNLAETYFQKVSEAAEERLEPFLTALGQGSDRATAIVSACLLDNLLERLIRAFYVKDLSVKMLFKNDHILQSFFAKINIAYFSGLIPKVIYHDLKLICEIRNKFAHEVKANLNFKSNVISQRINSCEVRPKTMDDVPEYRMKYLIIIVQLTDHLGYFEHLLLHSKPPNLVESFKLNEVKWEEIALTKKEIINVIRKERARSGDKE